MTLPAGNRNVYKRFVAFINHERDKGRGTEIAFYVTLPRNVDTAGINVPNPTSIQLDSFRVDRYFATTARRASASKVVWIYSIRDRVDTESQYEISLSRLIKFHLNDETCTPIDLLVIAFELLLDPC